jgi:hypothetical protein
MDKDEALKLALDDLIAEYHMETSSFAKRVDEIFKQARSAPVQEPVAKDNSNYRFDPPEAEPAQPAPVQGYVTGLDVYLDPADMKPKRYPAAQPAPVQEPVQLTIPEGMVLVPYEPSTEMQEQGSTASGYDLSQKRARHVYQSMIDMHVVREGKQARSAPVQEPVAWMGTDIEGNPNKFRLNPFNGGIELYKKPQSVKVWDAEGYDALMQELELWKAAAQRQWVGLTEREIELLDGMIEVQLDHAKRCDSIANRTMAEKQKGWDMERVALLKKLKENT